MATIVLSAAGMAVGNAVGGSVLGLSAAVIGRAAGAIVGRRIDERLLGSGSAPVETGRVDRFRLTGASEGTPLQEVHGRMRVSGQVIWASQFRESSETTGGGKGGPSQPEVTTYSYTVSLAIALCKGEITRVGRVWADGVEISPELLNMKVYFGGEDQMPDPKMEAVEGVGQVPSYRGMAYVVCEDMPLGPFGSRIPQLSFEVFRPAPAKSLGEAEDLAHLVQGVAMIPGTGEYSVATRPVYLQLDFAESSAVNINSPSGKTDFLTSLDALDEELPDCGSVVFVVSWFGDDLRVGECNVMPKVEQKDVDSEEMAWRVSGVSRAAAALVPQSDGRPVYGGTPSDAAVMEAITALREKGKDVVFYPFILMEQMPGNTLDDPYTGAVGQPVLPWRGRITTVRAPGVAGSTDGTSAADAEVATFFGTAAIGDFVQGVDGVDYTGPAEWSLRRFILHQAHLCAAAGGVDAFCIGSEMRGLTQIRGAGNSFPAVQALRQLAADVRAILGPGTKISYAADWSEYHGYQPVGTGDKFFHLDPLWSDTNIDFIGIDNYMPLSDWRDGEDHADVAAGSIYDLDYLVGNVAGGEGYDWYYASDADRADQIRTPITDGEGEPWVWRYKDLKGWWNNTHYERIGGVRQLTHTSWTPRSKPIWFTEFGCAAIDKGTNQPNKFLDPKSSESTLPHHSNGFRDDFIQMQYLRAVHRHFADNAANPVSDVYNDRMVDMTRAHVWAWDARPFPWFPALDDVWSDGGNYTRGHWLNGRSTSRSLASVVAEICASAGVSDIDTRQLYGVVRGFRLDDTETARGALQSLMITYGFDAVERDGRLVFRSRDGWADGVVPAGQMVLTDDEDTGMTATRVPEAEVTGRVQVSFVDAEADYDLRASEAAFVGDGQHTVSGSELPLALTQPEGQIIAERWLAEARMARDTVQFALPASLQHLGAGDVVDIEGRSGLYRIDRVEQADHRAVEAVRVDPEVYRPHEAADADYQIATPVAPVPVEAVFLDLPLMRGDEAPHAPHIAATARPWPGAVALFSANEDAGYQLDQRIAAASIVGTTLTAMPSAPIGTIDRGEALRVKLVRGALSDISEDALLSGGNLAAIGTGADDIWELFQFAKVTLVAPRTYDLTMRLRGQAGTDGVMPSAWPSGSVVVVMNGIPSQIDLPASARGVERHYRYGPASQPMGHAAYSHRMRSFEGIGLRPYPIAHLRASKDGAGNFGISWVRRTRIDGDPWMASDVPLGETNEAYAVRVVSGGVVMRELTVLSPAWTYTAAMQAVDGGGPLQVEVAQVSERFGPGPYRSVAVV